MQGGLGFNTAIPQVSFCHTAPVPSYTVPAAGYTHTRTVNRAVSNKTHGFIQYQAPINLMKVRARQLTCTVLFARCWGALRKRGLTCSCSYPLLLVPARAMVPRSCRAPCSLSTPPLPAPSCWLPGSCVSALPLPHPPVPIHSSSLLSPLVARHRCRDVAIVMATHWRRRGRRRKWWWWPPSL